MQKPRAITVLGWINIGFAIWGLLGLAMTAAMAAMPEGPFNPMSRYTHDNPALANWLRLAVPLGVVSSVLLVISGIGLLKLRPWGRLCALGYAAYAILLAIVSGVMTFRLMVRPMLAEIGVSSGDPAAFGALVGGIASLVGVLFALAYPIVLIVFMTRPKIVAAFRTEAAPDSTAV